MAGNKLILDVDGLTVGGTQLTSTGGDISVGNNLVVGRNLIVNGYISGPALDYYDIRSTTAAVNETFTLASPNVWYNTQAINNVYPNFLGLNAYDVGTTFYFNIIITNGTRAYGIQTVQVDYTNANITMRWMGSGTPGFSASSNDIYSFQIVKTANLTYTVFGSKAQF